MTRDRLADAVLGWTAAISLSALVWMAAFLVAAEVFGS